MTAFVNRGFPLVTPGYNLTALSGLIDIKPDPGDGYSSAWIPFSSEHEHEHD
jgi:hypothetical protein